MPALLLAIDANGRIVGKCDAKCYNATSCRCLCICGGENHGRGLRQAAENALKQTTIPAEADWLGKPVLPLTLKRSSKLSIYAHPTLFEGL